MSDVCGLYYYNYISCQSVHPEQQERTVDYVTEQCQRLRTTLSNTQINEDIREGLQRNAIIVMVFPFLPCPSMCVSGQTGNGKTRFVYELLTQLRDIYAEDPPIKILYCYGIHRPLFDEMEKTIPNLSFHYELSTSELTTWYKTSTWNCFSPMNVIIADSVWFSSCRISSPEARIEDHTLKYDLPGTDEKPEERIANCHVAQTTISRKIELCSRKPTATPPPHNTNTWW